MQLFRHSHSSFRQVLSTVSWVGNLTKWPSKLPSAGFFRLGRGNNVKWLMFLKSATHDISGLTILYTQINRSHWCKLPSDKFKIEAEMILLWHSMQNLLPQDMTNVKNLLTFKISWEKSTFTKLRLFCFQTEFYVPSYLLFYFPDLALVFAPVCV